MGHDRQVYDANHYGGVVERRGEDDGDESVFSLFFPFFRIPFQTLKSHPFQSYLRYRRNMKRGLFHP